MRKAAWTIAPYFPISQTWKVNDRRVLDESAPPNSCKRGEADSFLPASFYEKTYKNYMLFLY